MIIKWPETIYQRDIMKIIETRKDFLELKTVVDKETGEEKTVPIWTEGEKGILYDLCVFDVPRFVYIDWSNTDLDKYVTKIKNTYLEHKNIKIINLVSLCINNLELRSQDKSARRNIIIFIIWR